MLSSAVFVPSAVVDHVSDAELLERVSRKASDANSARAAEAEFYARHARYLYCPDGSHLAEYDDQQVYMAGLIDFIKDVDAGRF